MSDKKQLSSDLDENYTQFLQDAVATGCVWALEGDEGFALCDSLQNSDLSVMPFWSQPEFAAIHCVDAWSVYRVVPVALEELLDDWLPGLHEDLILIGVNWAESLTGDEVEPLDLLEAFDEALA